MNAAGRLGAFGAGLAVAFAAAYGTAAAIVPAPAPNVQQGPTAHGGADHTASAEPVSPASANLPGLSLSQDGYMLGAVRIPSRPLEPGILSFTIVDPAGQSLRDYATVHDKQLHLIVVRSDGQHFRHVHPVLDVATGTWSTPWAWPAAGAYRVFADFQPAEEGGAKLTLTRAVEVAGEFTPAPVSPRTVDQVAGYTVTLDSTLTAGLPRQLTVEVARAGRPVTTLQPYLGAFGHLVALRDGDLAYLHVHPAGAEPVPGRTGGPAVSFAATAPTAGRYLLYLDFKVDNAVHTASFVVDAAPGSSAAPPYSREGGHGGGH